MSTYTPSAVALVDITLPGDGENIDAADVNGPMQEIADGIASLQQGESARATDLTAATGTFTPGAGTTRVTLLMLAGGGGGAGGGGPLSGAPKRSIGGGAGGGAQWVVRNVAVTPGVSHTYTIGAGGAAQAIAGAHSAATQATTIGADGNAGADTTFAITAGATLATAKGAGGGVGGCAVNTDANYGITAGGLSILGGSRPGAGDFTDSCRYFTEGPGSGGEGTSSQLAIGRNGRYGSGGFSGGAAGAISSTGAADGGAGGGGGGGGNGVGGAGGNGHVGGTSTGSTAGASAAANTGGGGGGGGGGGQTGGGAWTDGAAGGAGGSGRLIIIYSGPAAVIT